MSKPWGRREGAGNWQNPKPVWSLAALLGYEAAQRDLHWLVLCEGQVSWAVAFDAFEGYAKVPKSELHPTSKPGPRAEHTPEACRAGEIVRPVVSLPSLREAIQRKFQSTTTRRETL